MPPRNPLATPLSTARLRVCAVSYINTLPLVWGMMHGDQQDRFDLSFSIPSECADRLADGRADIGIVPCAELPRLNLTAIPGTGIACEGPVRSILLVSKVPIEQIRVLAADSSSRTSVILARIVLARKYGAEPAIVSMSPDLPLMLESADAALIIGDPALQLDPETIPFHTLDLGSEWTGMTGLPMVFAVWAGRADLVSSEIQNAFTGSCDFGLARIDEIARLSGPARGFSESLVQQYLRRNIIFKLDERHYQGMRLFLELAETIRTTEPLWKVSA